MSQAIEAYRDITADEKFKYIEYLRERAGHDEAQALHNAERRERAKWEGVVAEKDAEIERLRAELAEAKARNDL
jgi:hypothetical protein